MIDNSRQAGKAQGRGLGRGLSALLGESEVQQQPIVAVSNPKPAPPDPSGGRQRTLPVAFLRPNRHQPRRLFREEELQELAASIKEQGVLQPILVRPLGPPDAYEIVAGERRWRAAQLAKLHEVPVVVRAFTDSESLQAAIIENVQRSDLNALEEATAYQELMERFDHTQEQVADLVGKSRSHVANTIRLLKLPDGVRNLITEGRLTAGHARTLIGVPDAEARAKEIVASAMNVREAEKKVKPPSKPKALDKDADTKALESSLSNTLGLNVQIDHKGENGGSVKIAYKTLEQLDEIIRRLSSLVEVD